MWWILAIAFLVVIIIIIIIIIIIFSISNINGINGNEVASVTYECYESFTTNDQWVHTISYNDERIRYESRRFNIVQSYGDFSIDMVRKVELVKGETAGNTMYRVFIDFYTDVDKNRIIVNDKQLVNDYLNELEDMVWKINNEILMES